MGQSFDESYRRVTKTTRTPGELFGAHWRQSSALEARTPDAVLGGDRKHRLELRLGFGRGIDVLGLKRIARQVVHLGLVQGRRHHIRRRTMRHHQLPVADPHAIPRLPLFRFGSDLAGCGIAVDLMAKRGQRFDR